MLKKTPGVRFNHSALAEVVLWAPLAKYTALVLPGNEHLPLLQTEHGYWQISTDRLKPGDRYFFVLDDNPPLPDPASLLQPDGVHNASQAVNLETFNWNDTQWQAPPLEDYIIYELHTGTFSPQGTFAGMEQKLDYLIALGITAIEIMPVAQFAGDRNWGYDGTFPYAVQNSYGGPAGLMQLVNACHQKGLAVILDVVYNHIGPDGNYLNKYGPYFTNKYSTPWGNALNFDDEWCNGVREYFIENALMWLRDFHIDALRLDAVHAIKDNGPLHILQAIKLEVDKLSAQTGKTYYLITESDLNDPRFITPLQQHGYGMDAQWTDEFHHALHVTAGGNRNGYYEDFTGITHLAKAYSNAYVYDGQYSAHRKKDFGSKAPAGNFPGRQFVVFSQNHDQVGNRMLGERSSQLFTFEMQKLIAGAVLIAPYVPLLFMGEEWGAETPFQYFVSHTNQELIKAVREGRKAEFAAFHTEGEAPDPQAEETFTRSKLNWDELRQTQAQQMLTFYKSLIGMRRQLTALHKPDREKMEVDFNEQQQTLWLHRWQAQQRIYCFLNFSIHQQRFTLPRSYQWKQLLNSANAVFGGPGALKSNDITANIQPQSFVMFIS